MTFEAQQSLLFMGWNTYFFQSRPLTSLNDKIPCWALLNLAVHPGTSVSQSQSDGSFTKHCRSRSWRAAGRRRRGKTWRRSHCRIYFETPPWEQKGKKTNTYEPLGGKLQQLLTSEGLSKSLSILPVEAEGVKKGRQALHHHEDGHSEDGKKAKHGHEE